MKARVWEKNRCKPSTAVSHYGRRDCRNTESTHIFSCRQTCIHRLPIIKNVCVHNPLQLPLSFNIGFGFSDGHRHVHLFQTLFCRTVFNLGVFYYLSEECAGTCRAPQCGLGREDKRLHPGEQLELFVRCRKASALTLRLPPSLVVIQGGWLRARRTAVG